ncbi:putative UDP-rhamnose:rhamnosyltransferase 1 [Camellia lanceoleosa]|uniref:UDP-rhamnose:rhamnosyltransferase 1 n=1 Tax=Camellia lanceoleosa TaxID=1840588 RepID=A0ACC0I5B6_9ERIC|nr:putative UDP-rhamnose:rhamnosyltransferase 1 [Camellia lanceoleosa]
METETHVVLVPFIAFGHMMPFYELSLVLAEAGIRVSYVSTPRNIQRLPQLPPELLSLVTFVQIPLPSLGSNLLPEGAEATVDITADKMGHLKAAFDLLKQPFKQFVAEKSPDWIVTDVICSWTVDVAEECHVPVVIFSPFTAAAHVFVGPPEYLVGDARKRVRSSPEDLTSPPSWVSFRSSVAFRLYEAIGFFAGLNTRNASGITDAERLVKSLGGCRAVAIRSCREFEGEYLDLFAKIIGKPAIPVGLLLPAKPDKTRIAAADDGAWSKIFEWLEEQKPKSVVFVGFGSECKLTRDQTYEIASGLESSELPFLWALRKPSWASDDLDALPRNFNSRISGRGKVCIGWAPQIEILAHPSIGGSLFHAGWGSVIETLQFGHCMVVLPQIIDQPLNARLLVEKGLAIEVKRGDDGSFNGNDIARCLRKAMISEEGDEMRAQVKKAAEIFGDRKLHDEYVAGFVEYLKTEKSGLGV